MKQANPLSPDFHSPALGLAWLLCVLLVAASAWLVAHAGRRAPDADDSRRTEFVRAAAGIQDGVRLLRELERGVLGASALPQRNEYYRQKRAQARSRIDELARNAAALAESREEHVRLEQLAVLTRVADARYEQVLASLRERQTIVQSKGEIQ
jgi:hypothetical protein